MNSTRQHDPLFAEINQAIQEADAGDFTTNAEVAALRAKSIIQETKAGADPAAYPGRESPQ